MKTNVSGSGLGFVGAVFLIGLLASVPVVGQESSDHAQGLLRVGATSAKVLPAHDGDARPHGELAPATGVGATAYDTSWFSYAGATALLGGTNLKISGPLVTGGDVSQFVISNCS